MVRYLVVSILLLTTACSRIGELAENRADRAAYGIVGEAQRHLFGEAEPFTIDEEEHARIQSLYASAGSTNASLLSLSDTLAIAMANSRDYQRQKEDLFMAALDFSVTARDFGIRFDDSSVSADATLFKEYDDGRSETFGDRGVSGSLALSLKRTLFTGANITLSATKNLTEYLVGSGDRSSDSSVSFKIVQPLLEGFGPLVSQEPFVQAERSLIYKVRSFKRYQQQFVIDTASTYYSVLRRRDQRENGRKNYENAIESRKQTESYAKAGRMTEFQSAQARQRELNAADQWTGANSDYEKALDDFRFSLGLPIDMPVEPDPAELTLLGERGLVELAIDFDQALAWAISNRMDLVNQREQVEDKARKLEIAQRDFLPNLDMTYEAGDISDDGGQLSHNLSVGLDLPFDWTERRNAFRKAQISLRREERALEQATDDLRRAVRNLWRRLERTRSVYKNRLLSVELAERRVENATILLKLGRAVTRDLLEAQDDLLDSRNDATAALVDYTVDRLRFWNAIERLKIDPEGMWYEDVE